MRMRHVRQAECGQVRVAELQHAGAKREVAAVLADVTEPHQREQEAARSSSSQPGGAGNVAQPQLRGVRAEGPNHGQSALERLDIVRVSLLIQHVNGCSHTELSDYAILAA